MKPYAILLAGLCTLGTTLALAAAVDAREGRGEQRQASADARFRADDSNHDGRLSQSEWQSARLRESAEKFRRLDGNRDGALSREELQAAREMRRARHGGMREKLRALDADDDHQLSRAEVAGKMPRLESRFDSLDGNRDGKLSREEMRAGREHREHDASR